MNYKYSEIKTKQFISRHTPNHPFSLCFRFSPYFQKNFRLWGKFSQFYLFPTNFLIFICQKFLMTFLVIDHKFRISPYFPCFSTLPPCFAKFFISPTFKSFPHKFTCFLHTLRVFRFPPTLTMMHLCITQCTHWTPLHTPTQKQEKALENQMQTQKIILW